MFRKTILVLLALCFIGSAVVFALGEMNLADKTGDMDHVYAALFGGGLLGFVGILLLVLTFRKPPKPDPASAGATVWAVGMATAMDDTDFDAGD